MVIASLESGGAERVFVTLANGLRAAGREVDLVVMNRAGGLLKEVKPGVNVVQLDAARDDASRSFHSREPTCAAFVRK